MGMSRSKFQRLDKKKILTVLYLDAHLFRIEFKFFTYIYTTRSNYTVAQSETYEHIVRLRQFITRNIYTYFRTSRAVMMNVFRLFPRQNESR